MTEQKPTVMYITGDATIVYGDLAELETLRSENALLSERVKELETRLMTPRGYVAIELYERFKQEFYALKESKTIYVRRCNK